MLKIWRVCVAGGVLAAVFLAGCEKNEKAAVPKDGEVTVPRELNDLLADEKKADAAEASGGGKKKDEKELPPPRVRSIEQQGDNGLGGFRIHFAPRCEGDCGYFPSEGLFRDTLVITPNPGPVTFDSCRWWNWIDVNANLKPRSTYQVTVKAGTRMVDGRRTTEDFTRTFTTEDRRPSFSFASRGRYLPPAGARALTVKTVNVTNLYYNVQPVPTANIIQLLAREEERYAWNHCTNIDSAQTVELSGAPVTNVVRVAARLNEEVETVVPIRDEDGVSSCGVYLVSVSDTAIDNEYDNKDFVPKTTYRLVCLTDIGLSVRETKSGLYVWATSLTRGAPLAGLLVRVYGANNIVAAEGITDAEGWCACEIPAGKDRFAVVASNKTGSDVSFLALSKPLEERVGSRRNYVAPGAAEAFVWTERGIYRHDEKILVHAILRGRDGCAPKPQPVTFTLVNPDDMDYRKETRVTDANGSVCLDTFAVPETQRGGRWTVRVETPDGGKMGETTVSVEQFVPPQVRVHVTPKPALALSNACVAATAEYFFGGAAKGLPARLAVQFSDAAFAPKGWEAYRFGDSARSLPPNFDERDAVALDENGAAEWDDLVDHFPACDGPAAAVKMTVQVSVTEHGGRPAVSRAEQILHLYDHYLGVKLPESFEADEKPVACRLAVVKPDGTPCAGIRTLRASFERIDSVYSLKRTDEGEYEWVRDEIRQPMGDDVEVLVKPDGTADVPVPVSSAGDCEMRVWEPGGAASFRTRYWVRAKGDDTLRARLETPSRVTLAADKKEYFVGERPRLTVKAPFTGTAWLQVLNEEMVYSQIVTLTNATSEITLEPVASAWAPGVDVALSVVQACVAGQKRHAANRAWGVTALRCAEKESRARVTVTADVTTRGTGGSDVVARIDARPAAGTAPVRAVVTLTDEAILSLTRTGRPDPAGWFGETRDAAHPLNDIFNCLLPVVDGRLRRGDAKTGGGFGDDLFSRVSLVPNRRFKPLSMWRKEVTLIDGKAEVPFSLPEFAGEVRVTAVVYGPRTAGAGSVQAKVAPKLVMLPDAPRFAAPGDTFNATVTLSNRAGTDGAVSYDLLVGGSAGLMKPVHGEMTLKAEESRTVTVPVTAAAVPGQATLTFVTEGFGEKHTETIELPVRPAAPWVKTARTVSLKGGEGAMFANTAGAFPEAARRAFVQTAGEIGQLATALEWLAEYPYGCLEQTSSQAFPLLTANGLLATVPTGDSTVARDARKTVDGAVARVVSMIRSDDFVSWPNGTTKPWDNAVSQWAAHFLVEADAAKFAVPEKALARVNGFLREWSMLTNAAASVYACHTLALAGTPDTDRMLFWYDRRDKLTSLDRARLARAFTRAGDPARARELLAALTPDDVRTAAFATLAMLEADPKDARLPAFARYLTDARDRTSNHWGTTAGNAHALLALGAWYQEKGAEKGTPDVRIRVTDAEEPLPAKRCRAFTGGGDVTVTNRGDGVAFVTGTCLAPADAAALKPERNGVTIRRAFFRTDGTPADLAKLARGDRLIVELELCATQTRELADLAVEELLPACFEPETIPWNGSLYPWIEARRGNIPMAWIVRREARDDRMLFFSGKFVSEPGKPSYAYYSVRVVSFGDFILPAPSVEGMYAPEIRARGAAGRVKVEK